MELLIELIILYRQQVADAAQALQHELGLENLGTWDEAGIAQTGVVNGARVRRFAFHGTGCTVVLDGGAVSWDFGYAGRTDGVSPSRLVNLASTLGGRFQAMTDWKVVEARLVDAEALGKVHRPFLNYGDDLYYLVGREP